MFEIKGKVNTAILRAEWEDMMDMIPVIDMVGTGKNIALLRKQAGLTVRDLQDIFGFGTPQAIYKWQQGVAMPTIDNLVVLSAIFEVSLEEILVFRNDTDIRKTA